MYPFSSSTPRHLSLATHVPGAMALVLSEGSSLTSDTSHADVIGQQGAQLPPLFLGGCEGLHAPERSWAHGRQR